MSATRIPEDNTEEIYYSRLRRFNNKDVKTKLGLAELLFQALMLVLLV